MVFGCTFGPFVLLSEIYLLDQPVFLKNVFLYYEHHAFWFKAQHFETIMDDWRGEILAGTVVENRLAPFEWLTCLLKFIHCCYTPTMRELNASHCEILNFPPKWISLYPVFPLFLSSGSGHHSTDTPHKDTVLLCPGSPRPLQLCRGHQRFLVRAGNSKFHRVAWVKSQNIVVLWTFLDNHLSDNLS